MLRVFLLMNFVLSPAVPWAFPLPGYAAEKATGSNDNTAAAPTRLARLYFEDFAAAKVLWCDAQLGAGGKLALSPPAEVSGFKPLDAEKQKLVQMSESLGRVLVGVRDAEGGELESGWVLFDGGVDYEEHGDHGHWEYARVPSVWHSRLDKEQGNPAHLYVYGQVFYLANDRRNGYTRIDPATYIVRDGKPKALPKPAFHAGGGNHITLAVVDQKVGYGTWIDGGGPNAGRVDVTRIQLQGSDAPAYSFHLPSGAIHGAAACEGKVFFAPADGVCWVQADLAAAQRPEEVQVHHISLGVQDEKPRRTGAFAQHKNYVVLVTGRAEGTSLVLLNAREAKPAPIEIPLKLKAGQKAVTPRVVQTADGRAVAFVFHDHEKEDDVADELTLVDLDPNRDGECRDARIIKTIPAGKSAVEGHFGHHDVDFDADARWAFITNPGDGTIDVLSLKDLERKSTHKVGGTPTALVVRGGREVRD
jgi:hypothetical protein